MADEIQDYDDLMVFTQLQRQCVEAGSKTFLYKGQYYDVTIAEAIINQHIEGGKRDGSQVR
jgi:hypothetical protein